MEFSGGSPGRIDVDCRKEVKAHWEARHNTLASLPDGEQRVVDEAGESVRTPDALREDRRGAAPSKQIAHFRVMCKPISTDREN